MLLVFFLIFFVMDKRFPKQVFKSDIFLRNSMYGIFTFLVSVKNVESFNTHHDN